MREEQGMVARSGRPGDGPPQPGFDRDSGRVVRRASGRRRNAGHESVLAQEDTRGGPAESNNLRRVSGYFRSDRGWRTEAQPGRVL